MCGDPNFRRCAPRFVLAGLVLALMTLVILVRLNASVSELALIGTISIAYFRALCPRPKKGSPAGNTPMV